MTLEEEVALLREENQHLRELLAQALQRIAELERLLAEMVEAVERNSKPGPPSFVKPDRPKPLEPKAPRRKRASQHNHGRRQVAGVPADNNLAERSIRPMVIIRKISGGSRSREGTKTTMALASLLGTWQARGLNPFTQCLKLLSAKPSPSA